MEQRPSVMRVLLHWLFIGEVFVLVGTGFYLHRPIAGASHGIGTFIHLLAGYVMLPTVAFRMYWAMYGEPSSRAAVAGRGSFDLAALRHYAVYVLLWSCLAAQVVLGLSLRFPTEGYPARIIYTLGGVAGARVAHYLLMWATMSLLAIHTYQGFLAGGSTVRGIFLPSSRGGSRGFSGGDSAEQVP